ncbi:uncharacterized protein yc1106_05927 [Curvularia clavata]|uniref:Uncharacterized protein n=1 Tax=Curvularia clavata TaxID=95742 RepID=A0A9Q9DSH9_CURCL|nr:uncharacterized protein yc1106_05927 [Curvularia clavata]
MHAFSVVVLALGATAVSAQSCDPYCQFPKSMFCPGSGQTLTRDEIIAAAVNDKRSQGPRETSANNLATLHCQGPSYSGMPLYVTDLPKQSGALYYAINDKGTYFFCSTSSGRAASGWPDICKESN